MKRRLLLASTALSSVWALTGCASQDIEAYAGQQPVLDLPQYFNGTLDAYGVFTDRSGAVVKRFTVLMKCHWVGNEGTLDESFTYADGTTQQRIWHLTQLPGGRYTGRAGDVVGEATGQSLGNTFHWNYTLSLPVGDKVYDVQFDDWMYLMTDQVMLNKATMRKFGVRLGEVTLSFVKR